jgi:hypothetical protein
MTRRFMAGVTGTLLLCTAPHLYAQMCQGRPHFSTAPMNIGASVTTGNDETTIAGNWNFGSAMYFGGFGLGLTSFDDFDGSSTSAMGEFGLHMRPSTIGYLELCPLVRGSIGLGPEDVPAGNTRLDFTRYAMQAGVGIGGMMSVARGIVAIPFGDFMLAYEREHAESRNGETASHTDTGGLLGIGFRLSFANRFTIGPKLTIPLGIENSDPMWGLGFSLAVGTP